MKPMLEPQPELVFVGDVPAIRHPAPNNRLEPWGRNRKEKRANAKRLYVALRTHKAKRSEDLGLEFIRQSIPHTAPGRRQLRNFWRSCVTMRSEVLRSIWRQRERASNGRFIW